MYCNFVQWGSANGGSSSRFFFPPITIPIERGKSWEKMPWLNFRTAVLGHDLNSFLFAAHGSLSVMAILHHPTLNGSYHCIELRQINVGNCGILRTPPSVVHEAIEAAKAVPCMFNHRFDVGVGATWLRDAEGQLFRLARAECH
jgi:hypothetical protein